MSDKLHLIVPGAVLAPDGGDSAAAPSPLPPILRVLLYGIGTAGRSE